VLVFDDDGTIAFSKSKKKKKKPLNSTPFSNRLMGKIKEDFEII
jgi:hypothetical protein